jgi:DNA-binding NarL/FixJ family response regulator
MINVIIVSPTSGLVTKKLEKLTDIVVTVIHPSTLDQVVEQVGQQPPDIFIIRQDAETINGEILCHFLSKHYLNAQSLILINEQPTFERLKNSGFKARGYVVKEQVNEIDKAIRAVHAGEAWLPRILVAEMLNRFEFQAHPT